MNGGTSPPSWFLAWSLSEVAECWNVGVEFPCVGIVGAVVVGDWPSRVSCLTAIVCLCKVPCMAIVLSSMVLSLRLLLGLAKKTSHYHDSIGDLPLVIVLFNILPKRLVTKNTKKLSFQRTWFSWESYILFNQAWVFMYSYFFAVF